MADETGPEVEPDRVTVEYALRAMDDRGRGAFTLLDDRPDKSIRSRPAVDFLAVNADGMVLAIEHTALEPYPGYITDMRLVEERLGAVRRRLEGRLPQDSVFDIGFNPGEARRIKSVNADRIAEWVEATAPGLGRPGFAVAPPEVSTVEISLARWHPWRPGPQIKYAIGVSQEQLRASIEVRLSKSMQDKLPKLEAARIDNDADLTLICLDSNDVQVTDFLSLLEVSQLISANLPLPDYMTAVLGDPGEPFMAYIYREAGEWLQETGTYRARP